MWASAVDKLGLPLRRLIPRISRGHGRPWPLLKTASVAALVPVDHGLQGLQERLKIVALHLVWLLLKGLKIGARIRLKGFYS